MGFWVSIDSHLTSRPNGGQQRKWFSRMVEVLLSRSGPVEDWESGYSLQRPFKTKPLLGISPSIISFVWTAHLFLISQISAFASSNPISFTRPRCLLFTFACIDTLNAFRPWFAWLHAFVQYRNDPSEREKTVPCRYMYGCACKV
jgi:hypothetical protein